MIKRLSRQMTIPQILSVMTGSLCLLIDSIIIGQMLGVEAMSAFGLAAPIPIVFAAAGTMLANGIQIVCARALGYGDKERAGICFSSSVVLALVIAVVAMLLIFILRDPICVMLGAAKANETVFRMTGEYLTGYALLAPFFFLNQIAAPYLQAMGKRTQLVRAVAAMIATNVISDFCAVRFLHAGMFGIGVSSGLSFLVSALVCFIPFLKKDCLFKLSLKGMEVKTAGEILRCGSPVIVAQILFVMRVYCYNRILLSISGTEAVAAFSVLGTLGNILYSCGLGAGSVTMLLGSLFYSERDRESLCKLIRRMLPYTTLLITIGVVVFELASHQILLLFFEKAAPVYTIALTGFYFLILAQIANCLSSVYKLYVQSIGHTGFTHLISALEGLVMPVAFAWIFSRIWGLNGVWAGTLCGQFLTLLVIALIVWKKNGRISCSAETFAYLDADFGVSPSDCREYSVKDKDSAIDISKQAAAFCKERGLDSKLSLLISLCIEEMCMNVIEHGFNEGKKKNHLDVRLVLEEDRHVIRFRDDCTLFDPTDYVALHQDTDPSAHIGLRMIMALVKNASYVNSLGLNNLTLIL